MKKIFYTLLFIFYISSSYAREVININNDWMFSQGYETNPTYSSVNLPHTYNLDALSGNKDYYRGIGSYVKDIFIPNDWSGKRVFIKFYGANSQANLIVNGRYVGEHQGGYTAFTFEVTNQLRYGRENNFEVTVSNACQFDFMPIAAEQNIYGGLYRDVELIVVPQNHISLSDYASDGVYLIQEEVNKDHANIRASVKLDLKKGPEYVVKLNLYNNDHELVLVAQSPRVTINDNGQDNAQIPFSIPNPILWNGVKNPYLYTAEVSLISDGKVIDNVKVPLGLRYFAVDVTTGFSLNDLPTPIRGVVRVEDYAGIGSALKEVHNQQDIDLMLEMGANGVRMKESPHSQNFIDLCDKNGIIVWSDLPFTRPMESTLMGYIEKPFFKENGRKQLIEMIRQNYNHPSIIFWGIFSNLSLRGDNPLNYIKELNDLAHSEDPTRFTAAASNQDGPINFVTDVIGWNQYFGWQTSFASDVNVWLGQLSGKWKNLRSGISEYGAEGNTQQWQENMQRPENRECDHPQNYQLFVHEKYLEALAKHNFLWGSFVCSLSDYGAAARNVGNSRGVNEKGLVTFDRKNKKDAFYLYKAVWNKSDRFVYITQREMIYSTKKNAKIKVYSNLSDVNLVVNGANLGTQHSTNGIFEWKDVTLSAGENTISANSGLFSDTIIIRSQQIL